MTFETIFDLGQAVWHRHFPEINGYVEELSVDRANVTWAKVVRLKEAAVVSDWFHEADLIDSAPRVGL